MPRIRNKLNYLQMLFFFVLERNIQLTEDTAFYIVTYISHLDHVRSVAKVVVNNIYYNN